MFAAARISSRVCPARSRSPRPPGSSAPALSLTGPFSAGGRGDPDRFRDPRRRRRPHRRARGDAGTGRDHRGRFAAPSISRRRPRSRCAAAGSRSPDWCWRLPDDGYATLVNCVVVRTGGTGRTGGLGWSDGASRVARQRVRRIRRPTSSTAPARRAARAAGRQHRRTGRTGAGAAAPTARPRSPQGGR